MAIGIREARNNLPALVRRAAEGEEEIQIGSRGAEEVVLVATRKYERMTRELDRLRTRIAALQERLDRASDRLDHATGEARPFAGLQRALESGRLQVGTAPAERSRRYTPDYTATSALGREDRVRFGGNSPEPQYRRPGPRA